MRWWGAMKQPGSQTARQSGRCAGRQMKTHDTAPPPHRTMQSGDTDAKNHRATKSYSRHASPPPSSASVAGSTGVMGGWSPALFPPCLAAVRVAG
jgi:hypothetical protein